MTRRSRIGGSSELSKDRLVKTINAKLSLGDVYDANQTISNLHNRLTSSGDHERAINLCLEYALRFADLGEYAMAIDMGKMMLTDFQNSDQVDDEDAVAKVLCIFDICDVSKIEEKYRFMNRALKWSRSTDRPNGELRFQRALGDDYFKKKKYGLSQGHLLYCKDGSALATLIIEWQKLGYPSEGPWFVLRTTLMLLSQADIETAENFLRHLAIDFATEEVKPPHQLSWLLFNACRLKNFEFWNLIKGKYQLIIRRDKSFSQYLEEIESRIFDVKVRKDGLMSLLSAI